MRFEMDIDVTSKAELLFLNLFSSSMAESSAALLEGEQSDETNVAAEPAEVEEQPKEEEPKPVEKPKRQRRKKTEEAVVEDTPVVEEKAEVVDAEPEQVAEEPVVEETPGDDLPFAEEVEEPQETKEEEPELVAGETQPMPASKWADFVMSQRVRLGVDANGKNRALVNKFNDACRAHCNEAFGVVSHKDLTDSQRGEYANWITGLTVEGSNIVWAPIPF